MLSIAPKREMTNCPRGKSLRQASGAVKTSKEPTPLAVSVPKMRYCAAAQGSVPTARILCCFAVLRRLKSPRKLSTASWYWHTVRAWWRDAAKAAFWACSACFCMARSCALVARGRVVVVLVVTAAYSCSHEKKCSAYPDCLLSKHSMMTTSHHTTYFFAASSLQ